MTRTVGSTTRRGLVGLLDRRVIAVLHRRVVAAVAIGIDEYWVGQRERQHEETMAIAHSGA